MKSRIVIKIGSSNLSNGEEINFERIQNLASLINDLRSKYDVILVSSGAVASGYTRLKLDKKIIQNRQALASLGQPLLMQFYSHAFEKFSIQTAQVLLVGRNFDSRAQTQHARDCIDILLANQVLPIINENDTTALDELVGDNDQLSAFAAHYFCAKLLVILSDISGYFDSDPNKNENAKLLPSVAQIPESALNASVTPNAQFATGGIVTKLKAADFLLKRNGAMFLTSGENLDIVRELLLNGVQTSGTLFSAQNLSQILDSEKGEK